MKLTLIIALALCWSASAHSQPAELSSQTGHLKIPALVVDGRAAYSDLDMILLNQEGDFKLVDFSRKPAEDNGVQELTLAFGESKPFNDTTTIAFTNMLSDSRCPTTVFCITSGDITVLLEMTETLSDSNTKKTLFGVTLNGLSISEPEVGGYFFRLAAADPYPVDTTPIADEDYVITIEYSAVPFKK